MFEFDASLLRADWMRPPCWRWNLSMGFLANPDLSLSKTRRDSGLYESSKYYRDKKHFKKNPSFYVKRYPEMSRAHDLFYHSHYGGWRWYIEALLMTGLDDDEIIKALKVNIPKDVISLYRTVFFDVNKYLKSEVAVGANILSTARLNLKGKQDCDYTWKLFAYSWGADPFIEEFSANKQLIESRYSRWFRDLAKERLTINAFQLASDLKKTYNLETLEILKIAKDYWNITDQDMAKAQGLADTDFVSSLSGHIDMCLMNAKERDPVEKRPDYKYSFLEVDESKSTVN